MSRYDLNVSFSNEDLHRFYATGTNVVMAKSGPGGSRRVNWLAYKPMRQNSVRWEDLYGIYASNTEWRPGVLLEQFAHSDLPATSGRLYELMPSGVIAMQPESIDEGTYGLENQYRNDLGYMTVGLYQDAIVDGTKIAGSAVSAISTLFRSTAIVTPYTTVDIWMQSAVVGNSIASTVTSPLTRVLFGRGATSANLVYNSDSGSFIQTSNGDKNGEAEISTLEARL